MSTQMMKAVQQHAFGGPEVLSHEDAPMPVLQAGGALVQVHAVGVNPPDSYLRDGYQQLPPEWRPRGPLSLDPRDRSPGWWWRGRMTSGRWRPATKCMPWRVFRKGRQGQPRLLPSTLACWPGRPARKPQLLSHQQAAAVPMSLLTAWQPGRSIPGMRWRIRRSRAASGRCRWRVNASWPTVRQGKWSFRQAAGQVQGAEVIARCRGPPYEAFFTSARRR